MVVIEAEVWPVNVQAIADTGSKVVSFFASIDRKAEGAGVFPKLEQAKVPGEIRNRDGSVSDAVDDVSCRCACCLRRWGYWLCLQCTKENSLLPLRCRSKLHCIHHAQMLWDTRASTHASPAPDGPR